ncbi:hypothetical protein PtB15_1B672 [Puccinia triticina]|nr:hypothetical protein PtB15_1B672 [Puccinia triticina]
MTYVQQRPARQLPAANQIPDLQTLRAHLARGLMRAKGSGHPASTGLHFHQIPPRAYLAISLLPPSTQPPRNHTSNQPPRRSLFKIGTKGYHHRPCLQQSIGPIMYHHKSRQVQPLSKVMFTDHFAGWPRTPRPPPLRSSIRSSLSSSALQIFPLFSERLKAFAIQFDPTERRGLLFQRYVHLARTESPQSVERWTGQDSLDAPMPAANQLTVHQIKIFLALCSVDYPVQAKRGHLVKLYIDEDLAPGRPVQNNTDESDAENSVRLREYDHHAESSEPRTAGSSSPRSSFADSRHMSSEGVDRPSSPGTSFAVSPSRFDREASFEPPAAGSSSRQSSFVDSRNSSEVDPPSLPGTSFAVSPSPFDTAPTPPPDSPTDALASQESSSSVSSLRDSSSRSKSDVDREPAEPSVPGDRHPGSFGNSSVPTDRDSQASSAREVQSDIGEESHSFHKPLQEDRATSSSQPTPSSHQEGSPTPSSHQEGSPSPSSHREGSPTPSITGTPEDRAGSSIPARSGKRKSEAHSHWPDPSELSREEIEAYLTVHGVAYNENTRMARHPASSDCSASSNRRQRRNQVRVQQTSNYGSDEEHGFVYRPAGYPRNASVSPTSPASSSNYQPSLAYTETTEQHTVRSAATALGSNNRSIINAALGLSSGRRNVAASGSARRNLTSPPIEKHRGKRAKPTSETQRPAQRRPRTKKSQPRGRRGWRRPVHQANDDINFVPALPETSKKRSRADDLSPNANRAKQARKAPACSSATRWRRQSTEDSYRVRPSFHDDPQVEAPVPSPPSNPNASKKRIQPQDFLPRCGHGADNTNPLGNHHPSTSQSFHDDNEPEPALAPHDQGFTGPEGPTSHSLSPAAFRTKRKQPDHFSPIRASGKRRAIPTDHSSPTGASVEQRAVPATSLGLIPTSAQARHRRQRHKRPRRNSLIIRPSFHDDEVFLPNQPSSPSGPRGMISSWRSSVPRGVSPPPRSPTPQAHDRTRTDPMAPCPCINYDHSSPRPTAGCPCVGVGQNMLTVFTQATDRLADCLEMAQTASLRPSTSQVQMNTGRPLHSSGNRDLALLRRVRTHIQTLFGKTMELHQFPPPATEGEKANWNRDQHYRPQDGSDDKGRSSSSSSSDDNDNVDPHFPYPDGPGHKDASATTLRIMWRSMRRAGVVSFQPDLSRGAKHVDNLFLWDLAHNIFMKLVRAQEYRDVDMENTPEEKIRDAILNHAKQLQRTYREAGWDPERLDKQCIKKRRTARTKRLRKNRVKFLSRHAALVPLIPVITQFTSDAETDPGEPEDSNTDGKGEQRPKRVIVERLPWRHA